MKNLPFQTLLSASLIASPALEAQTVTFQTLLQELADRDSFAIHPNGAYTQHDATSHDPRNALGQSPLQKPHGGMNVDFGNYIRSENNGNGVTEHVVMEDTSGPGVLTRWWATAINNTAANNNYRIYLDGNLILTDTMNSLLGANNNGFGNSLNFFTPERGGDFYAPLPYSSSIKITWDGPLTHAGQVNIAEPGASFSTSNATWYCINYRRLAPGTSVTTFTNADKTTYAADLAATNTALASPTTVSGDVSSNHVDNGNLLANGQSLSHSIAGTGAIRRLMVNVSGSDQVAALKDTYIELIFDGFRTARVPVGHFFANGESENSGNPYNDYEDYFRKVNETTGDLTCYWVMPFQTTAEIRIVNESGQDVTVNLEIDSGSWTWDGNSMHFYSDFLIEDGIQTYAKSSRGTYDAHADADWRMLTVRGKGVLVGDTLSILNTSYAGGGSNNWWGEGDEKLYIDYIDGSGNGAAATPNHIGTGTEDYYGYSFGSPSEYGSPFVGQPFARGNGDQAGSGGLTVNSRVRGLDAVPFNESFKFDMEIWKWRPGNLDYDAVVHWYGIPGAKSLVTGADLGENFKTASVGQTAQDASVVDTSGDGSWRYMSSNEANPSTGGATLQDLTYATNLGSAGNSGYGAANQAIISNAFIGSNGDDNLGINGSPGYHEVAVSPAASGQQYTVARWTAGADSEGIININGSIRNLINSGDSVDFAIYVNGTQEFSVSGTGTTLTEQYFDFDKTIVEGDTVDFVLGNGGSGDIAGDESLLRAIILREADQVAQPGEPVLANAAVDTITETTANATAILSNSAADVTLFWDTTDNGTGSWPNSNALGNLSTGAFNGTITGLSPDTRYFYRFYAVNTTPDPDLEDWSEVARSFGSAFAVAQVATGLNGTALNFKTIDLSWTESFSSETGFQIERSIAGANTWTVVGTATANATSFQDITAESDTSYDYRVLAVNESGTSAPSATVEITTPVRPPSNLTTVADYDFEDNQLPAGFTSFGNPTYADGKLQLDGDGDYIQISPAPIGSGTSDNFVLEFIVNATAFNGLDFAGAISNAAVGSTPSHGTNTGYGVIAQGDEWRAITSNGGGSAGALIHGPPPTFLISLAYVRNGGDNSIYVNGVRYDNGAANGFTLTDAGVLTIGGHGFDVTNNQSFFTGDIDRVRVSTFAAGTFQAADLLTPGEGAAPVIPSINIANTGSGLMGRNSSIDFSNGFNGSQLGTYTTSLVDGTTGVDGVAATADTTFGTTDTYGYVGAVNFVVPNGRVVSEVSLNMATYFDGGWFGPNATGPGSGNTLRLVDLTVPTLQVTSNGGATWSTIPSTNNNYFSVMNGAQVGTQFGTNPRYHTVSFPLDFPRADINGIRLIGSQGGNANNGFIGAAEFTVTATIASDNIASTGTPIFGVNSADNGSLGTPYSHSGAISQINDGVLGSDGSDSSVDTFNGSTSGQSYGYAGVLGLSAGELQVTSFSAQICTFRDGGWFGPNGAGPGSGGNLTGAHLTTPKIQVTRNNGATWTDVATTNDYLSVMTGAEIGGTTNPRYQTVTFELNTPQTDIDGIRVFGSEGGDVNNGFLAVSEVTVRAIPFPTPALAATNVSAITATTASASTTLSGVEANVTLFWDTTDHGETLVNWQGGSSNALGSQSIGAINAGMTGLTEDTQYFARFYGVNTSPDPDKETWSSSTASFVTAFGTKAVSDLAAVTPNYANIDLTWTDVFNTETTVTIERSLDNSSWATLATLGADNFSYTDSAVSANTQYFYRLFATNTHGNSNVSNVVSVTTPGDDNYAAWIYDTYPSTTDSAIIGFNADPDGDGMGNGLENFFGYDPSATDSAAGITELSTTGTATSFQHPENADLVSDISASYKWSLDLSSWNDSGDTENGTTVTISSVKNTPSTGITTVTATETGTDASKIFIRIEVSQQ